MPILVKDLPGHLNGGRDIAVKDHTVWMKGLDTCLRCWDLRTPREPQEHQLESQVCRLRWVPLARVGAGPRARKEVEFGGRSGIMVGQASDAGQNRNVPPHCPRNTGTLTLFQVLKALCSVCRNPFR